MGASVCLTAGGVAVISVRIDEVRAVLLGVGVEVDDKIVVRDTALLATLRAMWDMPKAGAQ
jgi:hypothetical protein